MNISPCVFSERLFRRTRSRSARVERPFTCRSRSGDATLSAISIQYAEFSAQPREVYTDTKVSASRNRSLQFMHSAMSFLDRNVRVGTHAGIGVRDRDSSEALSADDVRHFFQRRVAVDEEVIFRCVAVRPAIHGNAFDVAGRIESAAGRYMPSSLSERVVMGESRPA